MLREAVDTAAENPARFNLTMEEIQGRRKWLDTQTRQVRCKRARSGTSSKANCSWDDGN